MMGAIQKSQSCPSAHPPAKRALGIDHVRSSGCGHRAQLGPQRVATLLAHGNGLHHALQRAVVGDRLRVTRQLALEALEIGPQLVTSCVR